MMVVVKFVIFSKIFIEKKKKTHISLYNNNNCFVLFFSIHRYASPSILIAPRDTCYIKIRRNLVNGFILSYRSIDRPETIDTSGKFVRTNFKGAHLIETNDNNNGFIYTYIQYADPGGHIPKMFANRPQCNIILKEVEGIRRAMKNPIHSNQ